MWLDVLRILAVVINVIVMILLPYALRVRRPPHGAAWLMIAAIEIAWAENAIQSIRRIGEPWDWLISPMLLLSSILAFLWVLTAERVASDD